MNNLSFLVGKVPSQGAQVEAPTETSAEASGEASGDSPRESAKKTPDEACCKEAQPSGLGSKIPK